MTVPPSCANLIAEVTRMDEKLGKERHALQSEKGQLEQRRNELGKRITEINIRLNEIKWSEFQIGCRVLYDGEEFEVCGHADYWPLGRKIKKDGTVSEKARNLYHTDTLKKISEADHGR